MRVLLRLCQDLAPAAASGQRLIVTSMSRRHPAGPVLAALLLVFLLILSASMLVVTPFALAAELQSDPEVCTRIIAFSILFTVLAAVESWLLAIGHRRLLPVGPWLRGGWWSPVG